jgi:hypothetical protein
VEKYYAKHVIFITFCFGLNGCLNQNDKKTPEISKPIPLSVAHDISQCPDISGTYARDYIDSSTGEKQTITMNVLLNSDKGYLEFSNDNSSYAVDGSSHQDSSVSALEYQAGCTNKILVIQGSILNSPVTERRYSLENGGLFIRSKSLDEKKIKFSEMEVTWYRQQDAQPEVRGN